MKKIVLAILLIFAAFALFAAPVAAEEQTDKVILVSGYGLSTTAPDKVTITFAVETINPDAKVAQAENAEIMADVVAALKSAGITDENIKTSGYSIYSYELSEYNPGEWPVGTTVYKVTNSVEIISYNVDKAGSYIDTAVLAGANSVSNLQFGLSDAKQIIERNAAIISAVKSARADADSVSSALGLKITGTGTINVNQGYTPVTYTDVNLDATAMKAGSSERVSTTIESGEIKTTATVSIVYTY
ncbi:MAG: SIMPL domain-containing protein [Methanocorpusculum sp.]|nr:SIMPL domain-containing protein [Methanocorpusculum sp.]MDD3257466.1 SIMPL domain-containing protein [Methanocorpusculum sp.]